MNLYRLLVVGAFAVLPLATAHGAALKNVDVVKKVFPDNATWELTFPIAQSAPNCDGKGYLNRDTFLEGVAKYPKFLSSDDLDTNVRELAAFLANVSQETTGAACTAPDNAEQLLDYDIPLKCTQPLGGTCFVREVGGDGHDYCSVVNAEWFNDPKRAAYRDVIDGLCAKNQYFGRGALQITNPANYASASETLFNGDETVFLEDPDKLVSGGYSWVASLNFWVNHVGGLDGTSVTTVPERTTCHDAIVNKSDFGKAIEVINGNIECGDVSVEAAFKVRNRVRYYQTYLEMFGKTAGEAAEPGNLKCISAIQPPSQARCGADWADANTTCQASCSTGEDCSGGLKCFAGVDQSPCGN